MGIIMAVVREASWSKVLGWDICYRGHCIIGSVIFADNDSGVGGYIDAISDDGKMLKDATAVNNTTVTAAIMAVARHF